MKKIFALCLLACSLAACQKPATELVIISTTDTHSQVEPTSPTASKNADMGGYARRIGLIAAEREKCPDLLLFDSGDFSQGTPYFNFYHGRVEMDALNRMGYDAITLGNHEFDNGLDTLAMVLKMSKCPVLVANYDVTGTPLEGIIKPYTIIRRAGRKIGVFGLGVAPDDLIAAKNFQGIRYLDPLPVINETAALLREKGCDVVILLSHLGSDGDGVKGHEEERDFTLIPQMHGVDLILSGHTHHTYVGAEMQDADDHTVVLSQSGKSGLQVIKTTLHLEE